MDAFKHIDFFEEELAEYTGSRYAVVTDCCTHAIELALRHDRVAEPVNFSAYTYLSVLMVFHNLRIPYTLNDEKWVKHYDFHGTRIRDSARHLSENMYESGTITCVSFGRGKPLDIGIGGALLLDDYNAYQEIRKQRYDGRDLSILPWENQRVFKPSPHYKLSPDFCMLGRNKLKNRDFNDKQPGWEFYPNCQLITIEDDLND